MVRATEVIGRKVVANDGDVGTVDDLYFDDARWGVRYLVVRCGGWLSVHQVLLSPASVEADGDTIRVRHSRDEIRNGPTPDADKPVSRLYEEAHARYYGYPYYWNGPYLWGVGVYPGVVPMTAQEALPEELAKDAERAAAKALEAAERSHLRSAREVIGYAVKTPDGDAGRVDDLVIDPASWAVQQLVVDTREWWPGGRVLVAPEAATSIDWPSRRVHVNTPRDALKAGAPAR